MSSTSRGPEVQRRFDEAVQHVERGDLESAVDVLREAVSAWPDEGVLHWYLGALLHLEMGSAAAALEPLRRAVALAPGSERASVSLFNALSDAGVELQPDRWTEGVAATG